MSDTNKRSNVFVVPSNAEEQRLDNFLRKQLGLPKSAIYRLVRKGQVRVNGGRKKPDYRLSTDDEVRVPPHLHGGKQNATASIDIPPKVLAKVAESVLLETEDFLIVNKPAGMVVHGGSGLKWGLIDAIKQVNPQLPDLELAHRLDRDTSGCLFLAKHRRALNQFQSQQRTPAFKKIYRCLLDGHWNKAKTVRRALDTANRADGERHVVVAEVGSGKEAISHFTPLAHATLSDGSAVTDMQVALETGRTHQIRVHSQSEGHPILGDDRYGDEAANAAAAIDGFKRLQLHAWKLEFTWVYNDGRQQAVAVEAPLEFSLAALN